MTQVARTGQIDWRDTDLESGAGVAVWSGESRVTQTPLVQAVSVAATVSLASRPDVEVLHSPLGVRVLLVEPEPDRAEVETRGQATVTSLEHNSWNSISRITFVGAMCGNIWKFNIFTPLVHFDLDMMNMKSNKIMQN